MTRANFPKKVKLTCKSKLGCRRLATAVLQRYYEDKKHKLKVLENAKEKLEKMRTSSTYERQLGLVRRLENEFEVYTRFEKSPLYSLYFGFLEEVIENDSKNGFKVQYDEAFE